mmetsp:Transcript_25331/g.52977  ORF Transcript_25331/g.52977 Transcript_25331/m.52977 type:complete len:203 (+) Transcript_25331:2273-2881(+)
MPFGFSSKTWNDGRAATATTNSSHHRKKYAPPKTPPTSGYPPPLKASSNSSTKRWPPTDSTPSCPHSSDSSPNSPIGTSDSTATGSRDSKAETMKPKLDFKSFTMCSWTLPFSWPRSRPSSPSTSINICGNFNPPTHNPPTEEDRATPYPPENPTRSTSSTRPPMTKPASTKTPSRPWRPYRSLSKMGGTFAKNVIFPCVRP